MRGVRFGDLVDGWMDLVLGASCLGCGLAGRLLCRRCADALPRTGFPVRPEPCPTGLPSTFATAPYGDALGRMIVAHKDRGAVGLAAPLGRVLAGAVLAALDGTDPYDVGYRTVLVPVPSRAAVVRSRGHDPLPRILRKTAAELRTAGLDPVVAPLLDHRGDVRDQAGLDARARARNLAGSMAVAPTVLRGLARAGRPVRVVLCDDVITTGSMLVEAGRALTAAGVPVCAAAVLAATRRQRPADRAPR